MESHDAVAKASSPSITIRVSGRLFQGHLSYLNQMVESANECGLWPLLSLTNLEELDRPAVLYLIDGDNREFGLVGCPNFVREWMEHERDRPAA
jgi:hypothetical protein